MMNFEKLPSDTSETCDVSFVKHSDGSRVRCGYSTRKDADRCGKKADWIYRGRCGCGACDMTSRECDEHYQERTREDAERKAKFDAEFEIVREVLPGGIVRHTKRRRSDLPRRR